MINNKEVENIVVISADRNGSTAFMHEVQRVKSDNCDHEIFLGECFSQDETKNQPPKWWTPEKYSPSQVVDTINYGTGKPVILKVQMTWPNFNSSYFEINAFERIFFHRNLVESTLSRCIAQLTGVWHRKKGETPANSSQPIYVDPGYFLERFNYRLERYEKYLDDIFTWSSKVVNYSNFQYSTENPILKNASQSDRVENYHEILSLKTPQLKSTIIDDRVNNHSKRVDKLSY